MRRLIVTLLAGLLSLVVAVSPVGAAAQSGNFEIALNGQAVGTASFQFAATKDGFDSTSLVKVAMQGLDYALSKNEQLSAANQLQHCGDISIGRANMTRDKLIRRLELREKIHTHSVSTNSS